MKLSEVLTARGFIHQTSADIEEILDGPKRTIYLGVDPTADSIHAGNFVLYMLLRHLSDAGHNIIMLVGGGTGMIGDPKPDVERPLLSAEEINHRVTKLQVQASNLLNIERITVVNNYDWLGKINLIDFLRDIGKHFTVNELIKKEAISERLTSETGLSYTEFAYPLLQGYDYLELHRQHGCDVQVGGSDQWGNIISGVDLVRRKEQATVYALTVPLITDKATGKKFGKSEGNAVWLDSEKTTPYQFYQFWLNASDESVVDYLQLFTFLSLEEIAELEKDAQVNPGARAAQKKLAYEVTTLVHGEAAAVASKNVSDILFGSRDVQEISADETDILMKNAPGIDVEINAELVAVLVAAELATSKREARTFIESGAVSINNTKIFDVSATVDRDWFKNGIALLRRGKKNYSVLVIRD